MAGGKRKRRNRRRRQRRRKLEQSLTRGPGGGHKRLRMSLALGALDMARGHDGLFRGYPEPVVIVAAFDCRYDGVSLLTRHLFRYQVKESAPVWVEPEETKMPRVPQLRAHPGSVVILVVAIEEDSGVDIGNLYAGLDATEDVVVWRLDGSVAVPCALGEVKNLSKPRLSTRVGLRVRGGPPIDAFTKDDYVGTAAVWLPAESTGGHLDLAIPIASKDARNEWTPHLSVRIR